MPEGIELLPPVHTSFETAWEIPSYPSSRRLRCKRRVWVEHVQRYGQRFVYRTTNPKKRGEVWNTPHADTYGLAVVLYRDLADDGHIKDAKLHSVWSIKETCAFLDKYGAGIDDETRELIKEQLCDLIRRESKERTVHGQVFSASIAPDEATALLAKYAPAPKPAPEPEPLGPLFEGQ